MTWWSFGELDVGEEPWEDEEEGEVVDNVRRMVGTSRVGRDMV